MKILGASYHTVNESLREREGVVDGVNKEKEAQRAVLYDEVGEAFFPVYPRLIFTPFNFSSKDPFTSSSSRFFNK